MPELSVPAASMCHLAGASRTGTGRVGDWSGPEGLASRPSSSRVRLSDGVHVVAVALRM
jgi:hypothetical protein